MLAEAFDILSPQLTTRYRAVLTNAFIASPELASLHDTYLNYAGLDARLPRPVLAYFGYHAAANRVDFTDVDVLGDSLLIPQVLRDFLAIHDDIVDEDIDKFGSAPLPVRFSRTYDPGFTDALLTKHGKDLALYYGDFLLGVLLQLAADTGPRSAEVIRLLGDTLYVNQRGQLAELLAEEKPLIDTRVDDVFLIGERKAAYYCYSFPFTLGATMAGHPPALIDSVNALLTAIGTLSQAIDDLTGTFPGIIDHDKDTFGEIVHLRRTLPLVLLAHSCPPGDIAALLNASAPLPESDAWRLREHLWNSNIPAQAWAICQRRLDAIIPRLERLPTGAAATEYLEDLVQFRLTASVNRLAEAL